MYSGSGAACVSVLQATSYSDSGSASVVSVFTEATKPTRHWAWTAENHV